MTTRALPVIAINPTRLPLKDGYIRTYETICEHGTQQHEVSMFVENITSWLYGAIRETHRRGTGCECDKAL